jgi:hypothetical protein
VYAGLFEEVVIHHKMLVCFWPLAEQLGGDWFDLASLCKVNSYELEIYKSKHFGEFNYGFNPLLSEKRF